MPTIYRSTDAFAPQLDDSAGSLLSVLDACLVNGYGTGADEKPAAGWSKPYTGTNKAVYRNSMANDGTGAHFRVEDSGTAAKLRGHLTMSDVDTGGDNGTPAVASYPDGVDISKGGGSALEWILIADDRTVWLACAEDMLAGFGDFESFIPADAGDYFVVGHTQAGDGTSLITFNGVRRLETPTGATAMWIATPADQSDAAINFSVPYLTVGRSANQDGDVGADEHIGGSGALLPDPEPHTGDRFFTPALIGAEGMLRGRLRGMYAPLNDLRGQHGQTITGSSGIGEVVVLTAKAYYGIGNGPEDVGTMAVETDQDW
jgi:hypothetical protein